MKNVQIIKRESTVDLQEEVNRYIDVMEREVVSIQFFQTSEGFGAFIVYVVK